RYHYPKRGNFWFTNLHVSYLGYCNRSHQYHYKGNLYRRLFMYWIVQRWKVHPHQTKCTLTSENKEFHGSQIVRNGEASLRMSKIVIADYDPRWPGMFEEEKERLLHCVGQWVLDIEHIGSTAVAGLGAKPVIDI